MHPLQTQAVTYIVQRLESLTGLFFLATFFLFTMGIKSARPWRWYVPALLCCGLGMKTKEVMFAAPLLLVWYDRAFVASSWRELIDRRKWFYAAAFASLLLIGWDWLPGFVTGTGENSSAVHVAGLTPWTYLLSQAGVITFYLRLSLCPAGQNLDHCWPAIDSFAAAVAPGVLVVSLLLATIWAIMWRPAWSFLGGWFFLILAPTSSIVPIADLAVEHRMYLPLAAVVAAVLVALYQALLFVHARWRFKPSPQLALLAIACTAAVILVGATRQRNTVYASRIALWSDVTRKAPHNIRARQDLISAYMYAGRHADALRESLALLAISPQNPYGHVNAGVVLAQDGRTAEAITHFERAIGAEPNFAPAHLNLGKALRQTDPARAIRHLKLALAADGGYAEAYNNLGAMLTKSQPDEAYKHFLRALELDSNNAEAHNNLANLLARRGEYSRAIVHYNLALEINPSFSHAQRNRDVVIRMQIDQARQ